MEKWIWFMISIGCIFIMMSGTEQGNLETMFLGLALIAGAIVIYVRKYKKKK